MKLTFCQFPHTTPIMRLKEIPRKMIKDVFYELIKLDPEGFVGSTTSARKITLMLKLI